MCEPDQLALYLESFQDNNAHLFPSADFLLEPQVGAKRGRDEQLVRQQPSGWQHQCSPFIPLLPPAHLPPPLGNTDAIQRAQ